MRPPPAILRGLLGDGRPPKRPEGWKPSIAVLTMTRDEGAMLDRWVRHYGAQVGPQHLVVLDDASQDGSTDLLPCTVRPLPPLPGGHAFERTRMKLVSGVAKGLLVDHDYVIFADVDEFLIADPAEHTGLREFLKARPAADVIAGMNLNVVHYLGVEGPIDPSLPILGQRRFAKFIPLMCKPAIKRVPAPWRSGAHGITVPFRVDPELFTIHLKFHDRGRLRTVAEHRRRQFDADGRGADSNWRIGGDAMMRELRRFVREADPANVPEFDPAQVDLESLVQRYRIGLYRTPVMAQVKAMRTQPLVRVPERLLGLL